MMTNRTDLERMRADLIKLFQFNKKNLSAENYRILIKKRDEWLRFIEEESVDIVNRGFDQGDRKSDKNFNQIQEQIYTEEIFDYIVKFFSRYYDAGNFISRRKDVKENKIVIPDNGEDVSMYWTNMDQYFIAPAEKPTSKNIADSFIHKKLRAFLTSELDLFIKDELFDFEKINFEPQIGIKFSQIRKFKEICLKLIDFLAQIEDLKKRLWEQKKRAKTVDYCITLDYIDPKFYPRILRNKNQIDQWRKLRLFNPESNKEMRRSSLDPLFFKETDFGMNFLKQHPTLAIDTQFFTDEENFKDDLLNDIENFDEKINGILIKSDNFHALNILLERYEGKIKCCYIDPPYNTENDGFLFKDHLKHSTWLTMMENRLTIVRELLHDRGQIFVSIDNNEIFRLFQLMVSIFGEENFIENFLWTKTSTAPSLSKKSRKTTEYVLCFEKNRNSQQYRGEKNSGEDAPLINNDNPLKTIKFPKNIIRTKLTNGTYQAKKYVNAELLNDAIISNGIITNEIELKFNSKWTQKKIDEEIAKGTQFIIKSDRFSIRYIRDNANSYKAPTNLIKNKFIQLKSPILNKSTVKVGTNETSKKEIENFGFEFDYPKPVSLVKHLINLNLERDDHVLDFFAGSGTTGCAVLELNLEDNGNRKFILVEKEKYFDSILKPRIVKRIFSENWKDGSPLQGKGCKKQIIKYIHLEQYEDLLQSIDFSPIKSPSSNIQKTIHLR